MCPPRFLALLFTLAVVGTFWPVPVRAGDPAPSSEPRKGAAPAGVHGVDVSHYSGTVDWGRVAAAGYTFAYVKATEGVDSADPAFSGHWQRLPEAGLRRGAYHFYVTEDDPEEQARFFLDTVEHRPGDLIPAVDVEVIGHGTPPGLAGRLRTFLGLVEAELGVRPLIYTAPDFWDAHVGPGFDAHPLWVAEYEVDDPRVPASWSRWTFWQWKDDHDVPGVEKDADVSRLHPDATLDQLVIPQSH